VNTDNNILIPYASHLLHSPRPTMEGGRPYYFTPMDPHIWINPDHFWSRQPKFKGHVQPKFKGHVHLTLAKVCSLWWLSISLQHSEQQYQLIT